MQMLPGGPILNKIVSQSCVTTSKSLLSAIDRKSFGDNVRDKGRNDTMDRDDDTGLH